jgi:hypothetical protein
MIRKIVVSLSSGSRVNLRLLDLEENGTKMPRKYLNVYEWARPNSSRALLLIQYSSSPYQFCLFNRIKYVLATCRERERERERETQEIVEDHESKVMGEERGTLFLE